MCRKNRICGISLEHFPLGFNDYSTGILYYRAISLQEVIHTRVEKNESTVVNLIKKIKKELLNNFINTIVRRKSAYSTFPAAP